MEFLVIIAVLFIISVIRDSKDQKARAYRKSVQSDQARREEEQLHGSNKLDQYHWTGEYKVQRANDSMELQQ